MRYVTLEILACPMCRTYPLGLSVFKQKKLGSEMIIVDGLLKCKKCGRWYPVIGEIPRMLPDDMRPNYSAFVSKYKTRM